MFINEIYLIFGSGKLNDVLDVSNILKTMLTIGELHCIGAITLKEYIEKYSV